MEQQRFDVLVKNRIAEGYRRAGMALHKGDNYLEDITQAQLTALQGDARLSVVVQAGDDAALGSKGLSKNGESDNAQQDLDDTSSLSADLADPKDLTVAQLKAELYTLGVDYAKDAKKEALVALVIEARAAKAEGK